MEHGNALTGRERDVFTLVAQGKTSKEIGRDLHLSVFTVNNHRKHICKKLGLHSAAELIVASYRMGRLRSL